MTISLKAFEAGPLKAYWCNNGMIMITLPGDDPEAIIKDGPFSGCDMKSKACHLRPSELKTLIEKSDGEDGVILEVDEVRAGLFPQRSKIVATLEGDNISIDDGWYDGEKWYIFHDPVVIPKGVLPEMFRACCGVRDDYTDRVKIAPILGINVRDEEDSIK